MRVLMFFFSLLLTSASALNITRDTPLTKTFSQVLDVILSQDKVLLVWVEVRAKVVAPLMRVVVWVCLAMSVMMLVEALFMGLISLVVKVLKMRPEKRYRWEAMRGDDDDDAEMGHCEFPMVLIQIPMYNEKEVYKLSIGAACGLSWPSDRMIVQVLDDSTDLIVKELVELECKIWASKGMNINYEVRDNRKGYKGGALREGMEHPYVQQCDFVAIFDADFQPEADFLMRTIPFLKYNSEIALVQARWEFGSC